MEEHEKDSRTSRLTGEPVEVRPGRVLHIWRTGHEDADRRPVMLFVHGAGGRKEQWQAQIEHFQDTHEVIAFDMVGHGQNDKSREAIDWYGYGTGQLVEDLVAIVSRYIDPKREDNVLVAHSYGTVIAIKLLAYLHSYGIGQGEEMPSKEDQPVGVFFKKLILVCAAGERPAGTAHPVWYLPETVLEWIRPALGKGFVDKAWHPSTDRRLVLRESEIAATNPMRRPLFRTMDWTLQEDTSRISNTSLLFVSGAGDGITPPDSARTLASMLEENNTVRIEVLDNAAHMPMMEIPDSVNTLIEEFLQV